MWKGLVCTYVYLSELIKYHTWNVCLSLHVNFASKENINHWALVNDLCGELVDACSLLWYVSKHIMDWQMESLKWDKASILTC